MNLHARYDIVLNGRNSHLDVISNTVTYVKIHRTNVKHTHIDTHKYTLNKV